jgi:multidrug resistance efflux pump
MTDELKRESERLLKLGVYYAAAPAMAAHIAKLQNELDAAASDIEDLIDSVNQLETSLDEARKDAERYRWLRDVECFVWPSIKRVELDEASSVSLWIQPDVAMDSEGIDAAIDAAMERQS